MAPTGNIALVKGVALRVLVACEYSGKVRDAFIKHGFDAMSCDLLPTDAPGPHYQGSVLDIIDDGWDLMVAHPPCTYLCSSGLHWNKRVQGRAQLTQEAGEFAKMLWDADIPRVCIENPMGCLPDFIGEVGQWVQPYEFGHNASKKTGLWLRGLPPLVPTDIVPPRVVGNRTARWDNQTDAGQNKLPPTKDRWKIRSETYQGIADAMADQWGAVLRSGDYPLGPVRNGVQFVDGGLLGLLGQ